MREALISLFIVIIMIGCENESQNINSRLTDTWKWIRTDGGFNAHIHETPISTGNSYLLKFSGNNKISILKNDTTFFTGKYEIEKKESIYSGDMENYIKISDQCHIQNIVINGIMKIDSNTLTISDNAHDGLSREYKKIK